MPAPYRIFRPSYTDRATGNPKKSPTYHVAFRDHLKRRQTVAGFTTERDTDSLARRVMQLVRGRSSGEPAPDDLRRWFDGLDPDLRDRLIKMELIDPRAATGDALLVWHLEGRKDDAGNITEPGYRQALEARGSTPHHIHTTVKRVREVLDACSFIVWRDLVKPGATTRVEIYLGKRRADGKIGGATFNYFCRELRGFCKWMSDTGKAPAVAMGALRGVKNAEVDTEARRALSVDEMRWLLKSTDAGEALKSGMTGHERALLYRFAFESGIRPGQIRSLVVSDFKLADSPATVTARAQNVKRRTAHTQTLKPSLAADLAEHFAGKMPSAQAIRTPSKFHMAEILRKDLANARKLWLETAPTDDDRIEWAKSDFLADVNHQGERAVFYSTRHGHGTALADAGVAEKDIAASMHHTSRATTVRYLHADRKAVSKAIDAMPEISYPSAALKTGTDDERLRNACSTGRSSVESSGVKRGKHGKEKNAETSGKTGKAHDSRSKSDNGLLAELADAMDSKSIAPLQNPPQKQSDDANWADRLRIACASDASLTEIIDAWPDLSPAIKAGILAMVRAPR